MAGTGLAAGEREKRLETPQGHSVAPQGQRLSDKVGEVGAWPRPAQLCQPASPALILRPAWLQAPTAKVLFLGSWVFT